MEKKGINIWHLIGSTSTLLVFIFTSYIQLEKEITAQSIKVEHNTDKIISIEENQKVFQELGVKILIELETIKSNQDNQTETLKTIQDQNAKFESDIDKFYQLNKTIIRP